MVDTVSGQYRHPAPSARPAGRWAPPGAAWASSQETPGRCVRAPPRGATRCGSGALHAGAQPVAFAAASTTSHTVTTPSNPSSTVSTAMTHSTVRATAGDAHHACSVTCGWSSGLLGYGAAPGRGTAHEQAE